MFKIATQEEIGMYISKLVDSKFTHQRDFCRAWLKKEHIEEDENVIQNKANKYSQIKSGKKGIQLEDLPIFCSILDVSCEEILSAGHAFAKRSDRLTNYSVSLEKDKKIWNEYINHNEKLILNADEYGNTIIDYAIKFKNIKLIEYLINEGYIWLNNIENDNFNTSFGFGAGTSIEKRKIISHYDFYLQPQLSDVVLRGKLAALAIESNNLNVLKNLKAREIPDYYDKSFSLPTNKLMCENFDPYNDMSKKYSKDIHEYYNQDIIDNLLKASDQILDYFTNPIIITDNITHCKDGIKRKYKYLYFYISELLNALIKNNHTFTEFALRKAIKYSEETYKLVKQQINKNIDSIMKNSDYKYCSEKSELINKKIFDEFDFNCNKKQNIIRVYTCNTNEPGYLNVVRNLIHVKEQSQDIKIKYLIDELNELYSKIINMQKEYTD